MREPWSSFEVTKCVSVCSPRSIWSVTRDIGERKGLLTEHFAMISNLRAADCADVDITAVKERKREIYSKYITYCMATLALALLLLVIY